MRTARFLFLLLDYDGTRSDEEAFRAVQGQEFLSLQARSRALPRLFFPARPLEVLDFLRRREEILKELMPAPESHPPGRRSDLRRH